jgi:hypothetical protein
MALALLRLSVKPFAAGDTPAECNTIPPGAKWASWSRANMPRGET